MRRRKTKSFGRRRNRRVTTSTTGVLAAGTARVARAALPLLLGLVAIGGAGLGAHYGWQCLTQSGQLKIQQLSVTGNERTRDPEVVAYTGLTVGDPILGVDLDGAALGLRRHPWVRAARIRRQLPDQIAIHVEEHQPAILVVLGDVYVANEDGQVFKRVRAADQIALPVVTGLSRHQSSTDPERSEQVVRDAIALATASEGAGLGRLEELHWDDDLGWSIVTLPTGKPSRPVRIHLGLDPVARIGFAARALARLARLKRTPLEIWADGAKNPSRVQARLRTQPSRKAKTLIAKAGD